MKDNSAVYYLKEIRFEKQENFNISKPERGIKISETEFEQLGRKIFEEKNQQRKK